MSLKQIFSDNNNDWHRVQFFCLLLNWCTERLQTVLLLRLKGTTVPNNDGTCCVYKLKNVSESLRHLNNFFFFCLRKSCFHGNRRIRPADDELGVYLDFSCIETNHIASLEKKQKQTLTAGEEPELSGGSIASRVDESARTGWGETATSSSSFPPGSSDLSSRGTALTEGR